MSRKTLFAFIASFVLLIAVIVISRIGFANMKEYTRIVAHTREVISTFERLDNNFKSAQLYSANPQNETERKFFRMYKSDVDSIHTNISHLRYLIRDSTQMLRVDSAEQLINREISFLINRNVADMIRDADSTRMKELYNIHKMIQRGISHQDLLLKSRSQELERTTSWYDLISIVFGVTAVAIITGFFFSNILISMRRKWLEGFLESVLNTTQNCIVHYKAIKENGVVTDFVVDYANRGLSKMFKLNPSDVIGKYLSQLRSNVQNFNTVDALRRVVETGEGVEQELHYKREHLNLWIMASMARTEQGVTVTFHDITSLKKYEQELKENIQELQRSNGELEQYAYIASHDLQEPLRKIRSFGSSLQETQVAKMDDRGKDQLGKIMNSAERMSTLIKDILAFSSLKPEHDLKKVDLNDTISAVKHDLELLINQTGTTIISEELPSLEANPLQMQQLFYNLFSNSIKFANKDSKPEIRLTWRKIMKAERLVDLPDEIEMIEIRLRDNGIGFKQDYAEQIFGMFKRLNDRQSYEGSGIGLALCKKVVENHHGRIMANSEPGEGAVFIIQLPLRQPEL